MGRPKKVIEYTTDEETVRAWAGRFQDGHEELSPKKLGMADLRRGAAEACIDTVRLALELGGGAAYSRGPGIERLFRDVHGALYHPLPTAQQEMFTGRRALGIDGT